MSKVKVRVAVVMGGISAERDVSLRSGRAVLDAIDKETYGAIPLVIESDGSWNVDNRGPLPAAEAIVSLVKEGVDAAFLALHGPGGEDGTIQGFLETAGIPYTGSGVAASALAMDKIATRAVLTSFGLQVAPAVVVSRRDWNSAPSPCLAQIEALRQPLFVKAPTQGSSYGVVRVEGKELAEFRQSLTKALTVAFGFGSRVLVEQGLAGIEITVPVLGNSDSGDVEALPPIEIRPRSEAFFDTTEKYSPSGAEELCPPVSLTTRQIEQSQEWAVRAHLALGCAGMSRTDMIVTSDELYILEVNTIPGLTARSLLPQSAAAAGIPFPALVSRILDLTLAKAKHTLAATRD